MGKIAWIITEEFVDAPQQYLTYNYPEYYYGNPDYTIKKVVVFEIEETE